MACGSWPLRLFVLLAAALSSCGDGSDRGASAPPRPAADHEATDRETLVAVERDAEADHATDGETAEEEAEAVQLSPPPTARAERAPVRPGRGPRRPREDPRDPSKEAEVLQAFEDFRTACLAKDFSRVWRLASNPARRLAERLLDRFLSLDPRNERDRARLAAFRERFGLADDSALQLEPEFFFGALGRSTATHREEEWEEQAKALRALVVDRVEFHYAYLLSGPVATVICSLDAKPVLFVQFVKTWDRESEWGFLEAFPPGATHGLDGTRRLERKVAAYLPRRREHIREIGLVLEIGRDAADDESVKRLHDLLDALKLDCREAGRDVPGVLLDASPELSFREVIRVADALMCAGVEAIAYADSIHSDPPDGIHVNGVSLLKITGLSNLPSAGDHPALDRVIGLHAIPRPPETGGKAR